MSEVQRMVDEKRAGVRAVEYAERKDRVLIVEDEENARKGYEQLLQRSSYEILSVGNAKDPLARFGSYQPDTLIADVELPGMNGLDLLSQLGSELADVPTIIITGKGSEERAVAAIEAGAFWYIEKPLKDPVLRALLDRALSKVRDSRQLAVLQRQLRETGRLGDLVGGTKGMQEVMRIVEMPAPTQAKLLRVLEDRKVRRLGSKTETPVDVRVVAATNKDPEQAVGNGQLRQDLYFRLNVFHIHLPPLREHKDDIPLLVEHILRDVNAKHGKHVRGIGAEVMDIFMGHTWPGNIRELRNALERATIMCEKDLITRACLPPEFGKMAAKGPSDLSTIKFPVGTTVDAMERELILQTLSATGNNKTRAAELLGISLKTLHNKLKEYGGDRPNPS